jgi:outer membrane protein OmpA-like peptidoglycan-associated protein
MPNFLGLVYVLRTLVAQYLSLNFVKKIWAFLLVSCAATALAQSSPFLENVSAERLRISSSKESMLDVEWGALRQTDLHYDVGLFVGYAKNPVVLRRLSDKTRVGALVEDRLGASLVAAVGYRFLQVGFELPLVLVNERPSQIPAITSDAFKPISGVGFGDVRVVPKIQLLNQMNHVVDLSLLASLTFPSSSGVLYRGSDSISIAPEVAISKPFGNVKAAFNLTFNLRTAPALEALSQRIGNEVLARVGIAYRTNLEDAKALPFEMGLNLLAGAALDAPFAFSNRTPLEIKIYAAYDVSDWVQVMAGAGLGIINGFGIPDYRFFAGARFGSPAVEAAVVETGDADGDGVPDARDSCRTQAEDRDGFQDADGCPDLDNDGDSILDVEDRCSNLSGPKENVGCPDADTDGDGLVDRLDRCPKAAEDKDGFEDTDGCPEFDIDRDGTLDADDACANQAGPTENKGCPDGDSDADGIIDRLDNCPREAGEKSNQGCKTKQLATLEAGRIRIASQVYFAPNKAVLDQRSFALLDNVAAILKDHLELPTLRIEGHTDSQGNDEANLKLSDGRVKAVKAYLEGRGVAAQRLQARGFGESKPLADNGTAAGRAQNRRVEFNLGEE